MFFCVAVAVERTLESVYCIVCTRIFLFLWRRRLRTSSLCMLNVYRTTDYGSVSGYVAQSSKAPSEVRLAPKYWTLGLTPNGCSPF